MKVEMICWSMAVVGLILTGIGRRLIISEAASISDGWSWAVRLLPLADIMFLARFWDSAKTGAFLSLAGLMCFLPLGGKTLWDKKHPRPDAPLLSRSLNGDEKNFYFGMMKAEHEAEIAHRKQRLEQLNVHMSAWYANMTERRATLATNASPEQLEVFNSEAAAYQSLHQVTKEEAVALQKLLSRKMDSWGAITDAEYAEFIAREQSRPKRRFGRPQPTEELLDE